MENRIYFKKETYEKYHSLDENGHYDIFENKTIANESISSSVFSDLKINMKDIFE